MQTLTANQLKNNLIKKGIALDRSDLALFKGHDYFQIVNAYKYLFVDSAEDIDTIKNNIDANNVCKIREYEKHFGITKYRGNTDLLSKICDSIIKKYGIELEHPATASIQTKISKINAIKFVKHCYHPDANFKDFIRMFYLEHELRNVLIKYTLLIEEKIKKVFIAVLNESKDVDANYLADISNYNLSGSNKNSSILSLGMVIKMHSNKNSRPIRHKMDQELIVPYWILINEMTMGQTIQTIRNLKENIRKKIFQAITNEMSGSSLDIFDSSKATRIRRSEEKLIYNFSNILNYVGEFRNDLAHNEPLYTYNVKDTMTFERIKPRTDRNRDAPVQQQQHAIINQLNSALSDLYGTDGYNAHNYGYDIDLSWIIYVIGKISSVIKPDWNFGDEVREIFKKYSVCLSYGEGDFNSSSKIDELINKCGSLETAQIDSSLDEIKNAIEQGQPYKKRIQQLKKQLTDIYNLSISVRKQDQKQSVYDPFIFANRYHRYTRIDATYLIEYL